MVKQSSTWIRVVLLAVLGWALVILTLMWWTPRGSEVSAQAPAKAAAPQPAGKQPLPPGGLPVTVAEDNEPRFTDRVRLPVDRSANRKIERVKEWIEKETWGDAVRLLQSILNSPEDVVLKDEKGRWVSVRYEANRILGDMPRDGQQFYELEYGAPARTALKKGLAAGDPKAYAEIALRYMHTEAGAEANQLLGTYYLDQGCYIQAALCYERLLSRPGMIDKLTPAALYKAALAFERTGDARNRDRAWAELRRKLDRPGEKPLPAVLQRLGLDRLQETLALKNVARPGGRSRFDWPMFLGSVDRCAQAEGGAPFLEQRYHADTAHEAQTKAWLERALKGKTPLLSGYHPLAIGDKLIYRSYRGIHCLQLDSTVPVEPWFPTTDVSLDDLAKRKSDFDPTGSTVYQWADQYISVAPSILYDNSTLGTMSTDGTYVYLIEDLAIPPPPLALDGRPIMMNRQDLNPPSVALQPWLKHNRLVAMELHTEGKIKWTLPESEIPDQPFVDTFFLGAPLPLGDRLYALAETNAEIRLLCLDPANKGALDWSQSLCTVETRKLSEDPIRRTQATHLAYGEGILVCPTNAGAIIGVDLLTRSLLWAHSYQELSDNPMPQLQQIPNRRGGIMFSATPLTTPSWSSSAPVIRDGRVVFTAPDGEAVHCLNLRDGTLAWKERRVNDLYLAGAYRGKVLLVGRDVCRALNLADGTEVWKVEISMPSGRGVANATTYFLPMKAAEVWAIDIDTGKIQGKSRSSRGEVPGNLIFHEGDVISQTITGLTVYPQLAVRERSISESLAKDPNNPKGLLDRGELRLHQGVLLPAVEDLRGALKNRLPPELQGRARLKLYEALGDLLEANFAAHEGLLKEYEDLGAIPAPPNESDEERVNRERDQRDRQARLLRLVAKGREGQGRLKEAFQAYMDFASLGRAELISLPEDPNTRALPKVWAQGRIEALLRKSTPEQRQTLEKALEAQWQMAEAAGTLESMRQFVDLFGSVSAPGRRARLKVAERLLQAERLLDAEGELLILKYDAEPEIAAPALEALARVKTKQGQLEDAADAYRTLAKKYPKAVIRDGKTGEDFYLELMTDKRFLPYVEESRRGWMGSHTIEPKAGTAGTESGTAQLFWLEPRGGEGAPFFRRYRIGVDINNSKVKRVDRISGEVRDLFGLKGLPLQPYTSPATQPKFRPSCYLRGQLLVLSWGSYLYAYDVRGRKSEPLWSVDLLNGAYDPANRRPNDPIAAQLMVNQNGGLDLLVTNSFAERVGTIGSVEANCVCFLVREEGLVAVDPLRVETPPNKPPQPRKLWVKADVPMNSELFGDGEHLYVLPVVRSDQPPGPGYALRLTDGTPVTVPDFSALYAKKLRIIGRKLLLKELDAQGRVTLRLYDAHTGHDVWAKSFPPTALVLNSVQSNLTGVIDGTGRLAILRMETGAEVLAADLESPPAGVAVEGHLLQDDSQVYLALSARDPNARPEFSPPGFTLRSVPVNGKVYAFDLQTGKKVWDQNVPHQVLLIDQFEDLPILLFASNQRQFIALGGNQHTKDSSAIVALDKRNGAKVDEYTQERSPLQLHTLKVDPRTGQVELVGAQFRRSYTVNY